MRGRKNKYHPYTIRRRGARLNFLAGMCACFMLVTAAGFVAYAVFVALGDAHINYIAPYTVPVLGNTIEDVPYVAENEAVVEASASWYVQEVEPVPMQTPRPPAPPIPEEYHSLSFYIIENSVAYAEFLRNRPDLDTETVIWMVNSFAHLEFYSQIFINTQPNPLLITPALRLPNNFSPHELVPVNNEECHLRATPEAVAAFLEMREKAYFEGFELIAASAYRSASRQRELWEGRGRRDGSTARPHHSEHQTGRAIDLWGPGGLLDQSGPSPTGAWVAENAHFFGFIIRYRAETTHITGYIHEPWHLTFVGEQISMYMHENNILSLEEFVGRNPDFL
jgi:hypothetical protein